MRPLSASVCLIGRVVRHQEKYFAFRIQELTHFCLYVGVAVPHWSIRGVTGSGFGLNPKPYINQIIASVYTSGKFELELLRIDIGALIIRIGFWGPLYYT